MAGSKGGKHSKGKRKSKSNKSDMIKKKPEHVNSEIDMGQSSDNKFDGPEESNDHSQLDMNLSMTTNAFKSSSVFQKVQSKNDYGSLNKNGILNRFNLTPALNSRLDKTVPILAAAIRREIGASVINRQARPSSSGESKDGSHTTKTDVFKTITSIFYEGFFEHWLERNPADSKIQCINDLVRTIRDLEEEVKEKKEWAQRKVLDIAKKFSTNISELKTLRMEKFSREQKESEMNFAPRTLKLIEHSLQNLRLGADFAAETVRRLETDIANIRADTEAYKLTSSELDSKMKDIQKRERKWLKKLSELEEHNGRLQAECVEEKHRLLQLQEKLLQVEKEAEEAEMKWKEEKKEKEQMNIHLAEETRMLEIQKAESKAKLSNLRKKLEIKSQVAMDERRRLEDELSRLLLSQKISDISLEDDYLLYNSPEAISFLSSAEFESSSKATFGDRNCMICSQNEVDVVFLPSTHQVVCFHCYEGNCKVGARCPYCEVEIEQGIRVMG